MNIKDKLIELGVDIKDKDKVNVAKEELKKAGYKAQTISNVLSSDGEKILEDIFAKKSQDFIMPKVKAPATKKLDDEIIEKDTKKDFKIKIETKAETTNSEDNTKQEKLPFWKTNDNINTKNLKIRMNGQNVNSNNQQQNKTSSPNGRPLTKSTIEELNKKKNREQEQNKKNTNNKDRQFTNQNRPQNRPNDNKQQNQNKPKKIFDSKIDLKDKKILINQDSQNLKSQQNNKFTSKQKDKNKQNQEHEGQKSKKKQQNKKDNKYITNENNYQKEETGYRKKRKTTVGAFQKPEIKDEKPTEDIKSISIPESITVRDLSAKLKLLPSAIVKKLFMTGKMVTPNTVLSYEDAENIALEYNILCEKEEVVDVISNMLKEDDELAENLVTRPPVVCVMGHVDHGKTSILDAIRNTNVIDKEAGGITQHIGAYQVKINDRLITFLDTPGHEAFTAMRLRGAQSTDIAVLVVAADDGVKPQTIEAINHAKAANVEIVVAINKIDKPEANVDKVKQELSEYGLISEDWGGQTTFCEVSAKKNIGITNLLEMILLTADVLDLKANPNRKARGIVIEAELDKGKGPVARVLVQKGTLHIGDNIAMGKSYGKVRAMMDYKGNKIQEAAPSTPVEILGLNDTPQAGDIFMCFDQDKDARAFAETFISETKQDLIKKSKMNVTLDQLFDQIKQGELKELPIILKADVMGSAEALKDSLEKLSNEEVAVRVIHSGVGNINESDANLASASNAIIIGFNVKPENNVKSIITKEGIDVRLYDIIYNAIDDVSLAIKGMLKPVYEEKVIGHLTIKQIFKASSVGNIAGCIVNDGEITRNSKVRLYRGDSMVFEGELSSLKRFKDEVKEVKNGFECGLVIEGYNDYQVDDRIECYIMEQKKIV